jgi:hypothetical protein
MRQRGPFVTIGALGLVVLAVGLVAIVTSINRAGSMRTTMLARTIKINSVVTFAAPPSDAVPALTARQALRLSQSRLGSRPTRIPPGLTVKLGLLTWLVGPDCGADCDSLIVKNGLAYTTLNQLAYGFSRRSICVGGNDIHPLPPAPCVGWEFVDANTGQMILATQQTRPDNVQAPRSAG